MQLQIRVPTVAVLVLFAHVYTAVVDFRGAAGRHPKAIDLDRRNDAHAIAARLRAP